MKLSAPSEWVLHPEGTLVRLIRGVAADEADARAGLAIAACDPWAEVGIVVEGRDA